jgi:hypothetical protein
VISLGESAFLDAEQESRGSEWRGGLLASTFEMSRPMSPVEPFSSTWGRDTLYLSQPERVKKRS